MLKLIKIINNENFYAFYDLTEKKLTVYHLKYEEKLQRSQAE